MELRLSVKDYVRGLRNMYINMYIYIYIYIFIYIYI